MTSKRIVIAGGCALAFGAAFANTGLVLSTGTSVSHLTGDIAKLTISVTQWTPALLPEIYRVASAAIGFLCGAILAGMWVHHPVVNVAKPYGRTVTGIGILFVLSSLIINQHAATGIGIAAFGCGIQNALASHYRGIVLRTTHLTGMFTDLGITIGMRLRGHLVPRWKIAVPALLITSFFFGGLAGAWTQFSGSNTILVAGICYCIAGICWTIAKHVFRVF